MEIKSKFTPVVSADVAGYSRMMHEDEPSGFQNKKNSKCNQGKTNKPFYKG